MTRREYKQKWAEQNREKVRAKHKAYREKNRAKLNERNKAWKKQNREKRNAQARREYAKRREHYTTKVSEYLDRKNPARIIRRLVRQFKSGDIDRDELLNGINEVLAGKNEPVE
jgi:hypothetical protein